MKGWSSAERGADGGAVGPVARAGGRNEARLSRLLAVTAAGSSGGVTETGRIAGRQPGWKRTRITRCHLRPGQPGAGVLLRRDAGLHPSRTTARRGCPSRPPSCPPPSRCAASRCAEYDHRVSRGPRRAASRWIAGGHRASAECPRPPGRRCALAGVFMDVTSRAGGHQPAAAQRGVPARWRRRRPMSARCSTWTLDGGVLTWSELRTKAWMFGLEPWDRFDRVEPGRSTAQTGLHPDDLAGHVRCARSMPPWHERHCVRPPTDVEYRTVGPAGRRGALDRGQGAAASGPGRPLPSARWATCMDITDRKAALANRTCCCAPAGGAATGRGEAKRRRGRRWTAGGAGAVSSGWNLRSDVVR